MHYSLLLHEFYVHVLFFLKRLKKNRFNIFFGNETVLGCKNLERENFPKKVGLDLNNERNVGRTYFRIKNPLNYFDDKQSETKMDFNGK